MGSSTFNGPVRSQNGFQIVAKDATSGLHTDETNLDGSDARRYTLSESFKKRPALNAVINAAYDNADATNASNTTITVARVIANKDFEILGSNMTTALVTFNTTDAGIMITTAGTDEDQAIIAPHLDTNQTAWASTVWGSENSVQWECNITTVTITDVKIWAGIKLTNDQLVATDDDQAYFKFQTDATNSEAFTDYEVLHFVYSVGGTDYITALPITIAAGTKYHLKIVIDANRQATIYVNGTQYNIANTAGSTGGTTATKTLQDTAPVLSNALTTGITFIPYIGIETGTGTLKSLVVANESISRLAHE